MDCIAGTVEGYYRLHARIYDATRWSFLFGRGRLLCLLPDGPRRILEVGCGTGTNLARLCRRFPEARVEGRDLSAEMLAVARRKLARFGPRVALRRERYPAPGGGGFDLILFSYALTMFNPGFEEAIAAARNELSPGGHIAVVDFHSTPLPAFSRWMACNHVRMSGQLRPLLRHAFTPHTDLLRPAYGGLWRYLLFIGRRP